MMRHFRYPLVFCITFFTIATLFPLAAMGSREKGAAGQKNAALTEEARTIDVYTVSAGSPQVGTGSRTAGAEAAVFLFQKFTSDGNTIKIGSSRRFSMPRTETQILSVQEPVTVVRYRIQLTPLDPIQYRILQRVDFEFSLTEIVEGGRVRLQPGRKALLEALGNTPLKQGFVRIEVIRLDRSGRFSGTVEVAEQVE